MCIRDRYRTWPAELPRHVEVRIVQLPGRENRMGEAPYTGMEALLPALEQAIRPQLSRPFAFFGHRLGALLAFELARALRRSGGPEPVQLFVSGRPAPHLLARDMPIHALPDAAFIEQLRVQYNGIPPVLLAEPELLKLFLPILRADLCLIETARHTGEETLDLPISAFGGLRDPRVTRDDLAAWHAQTRRAFTLQMFPGDHFYLQTARTQLLRTLTEELEQLLMEPL